MTNFYNSDALKIRSLEQLKIAFNLIDEAMDNLSQTNEVCYPQEIVTEINEIKKLIND